MTMTKNRHRLPLKGDFQAIVSRINMHEWDKSEDERCEKWFGSRYLGNGMLLCSYCLENQVEFRGYFMDHVCEDCQESVKELR